jgi:hypothetical protein
MRQIALTASLALSLAACGHQTARAPSWDMPIPASEQRAELALSLSLEPVSDCDERFALSLYEERGVELISWDESFVRGHGCAERRATVRYVPGRVTREALLARIRKLSRKVEVIAR